MKILAIIPAYNEQESIEKTVQDIKIHAPEVDYLVINDCSTDGTREILRRQQIPYIDLPVNLGIGGGVQTGYQYALEHGYDIAIQFDGDGQHMAQYIPDLIEPIAKGDANMVIGSRFIAKEGFQSTALRRFGINFLSALIRLLCGIEVQDVTSGFRAADRTVIALFAGEYAQDYPEPEAIMLAGLNGAKVREVPVQMRERQGGVSSINAVRSAYYMVKVSLALVLSRMTWGKGKVL